MKDGCQTRIEFGGNEAGQYYKFTDYPKGEEWTPETPVTYELFLTNDDLWKIIDDAVKVLQKSPARRSKWRRVMEALRS
jgi:hypothetical protein